MIIPINIAEIHGVHTEGNHIIKKPNVLLTHLHDLFYQHTLPKEDTTISIKVESFNISTKVVEFVKEQLWIRYDEYVKWVEAFAQVDIINLKSFELSYIQGLTSSINDKDIINHSGDYYEGHFKLKY